MSKSNTLSFTVPNDIKLKLDAISKVGHYDSLSEFLRDAIRSHFSNNKDLRISIAHYLFNEKKIGIGKAAEIVGENIQETEKLFKERNI